MSRTCQKCGACCIAPSIAGAIPNMPDGKPVGVRCANLTDKNECALFGRPERPTFCLAWPPDPECCGSGFEEAMRNILALENATATPGRPQRRGSQVL